MASPVFFIPTRAAIAKDTWTLAELEEHSARWLVTTPLSADSDEDVAECCARLAAYLDERGATDQSFSSTRDGWRFGNSVCASGLLPPPHEV